MDVAHVRTYRVGRDAQDGADAFGRTAKYELLHDLTLAWGETIVQANLIGGFFN